MVLWLIILTISIIIGFFIGLAEDSFFTGLCGFGLCVFALFFICSFICVFIPTQVIEKYEVKQYDIQGLENKVKTEKSSFGVFVLGIGYAENKENKIEKYYYFKVNEYGKQLESVNINDYQLYIKETNEKEPCLIYIYEKHKIDNWFYKSLSGTDTTEKLVAKQLVFPVIILTLLSILSSVIPEQPSNADSPIFPE